MYQVSILHNEKVLGGGFFMSRRYAVTANHCLRRLPADERRVLLRTTSGDELTATVLRRDPENDLALLHLESAWPGILPIPAEASPGLAWRGSYRPGLTDPVLAGSVVSASMSYKCVGGATIDALQLDTSTNLGDYSGYSGGPVELDVEEPTTAGSLLGILIEQYPDRFEPGRASNVLFAASYLHILSKLDELPRATSTLEVTDIRQSEVTTNGGRPHLDRAKERTEIADHVLKWIEANIDGPDLRAAQVQVAQVVIERSLEDMP